MPSYSFARSSSPHFFARVSNTTFFGLKNCWSIDPSSPSASPRVTTRRIAFAHATRSALRVVARRHRAESRRRALARARLTRVDAPARRDDDRPTRDDLRIRAPRHTAPRARAPRATGDAIARARVATDRASRARAPSTTRMSKKNNRATAANRVEHAKRVELAALERKEARRQRKMRAMALASDAMAIDDARGARSTTRDARLEAKNVRAAQSLRLTGGVRKVRAGKNTHKVVRGVAIGRAKLRKNAVVRGIKIVDATTKRAALDAIAEASGGGGATAMRG